MDPLLWKRIGELFAGARPLSGDDRAAFLKENCDGDEALLQQVVSLLDVDGQSGPLDSAITVSAANLPRIVAGRFRIIRYIAEGGMGTVYEAEDLKLGDRVALKAIRSDIVSDPRAIERFKREISLGKKVTHPNVCRIYDLGVDHSDNGSEFLFLTMQFLSGETLAGRIKRGPLPKEEALPLIEDMTAALSAAHQAEVIHRDFKSGNVMLVNGGVRTCAVVTDFGLARHVRDNGSVTQAGMVGTVSYMAPEQIRGEELTPATDIYALGVVMYEMATGELPFKGDSKVTVALKHLNDPPPSPRTVAPQLDRQWEETILRCLRKGPHERFQSAGEIGEALGGQRAARLPARAPSFALAKLGRVLRRATIYVGTLLVMALIFLMMSHALRGKLAAALHLEARGNAPPAFVERDRILLTDFDNQTNDPSFDRTVRDLLGQALSQSSFVNVVPRLAAVDAARRTGAVESTHIDANLGRQICIRESYRAMLIGVVKPHNSGFLIEITVEDPQDDRVLIRESEAIHSPKELYETIDRLAARLRERLGESLKEVEHGTKPLAEVTTPSLEALRRYSQAVDLFASHQYSRSIQLANDAVALDPHFAMAHLLLARAYDDMGDDSKSRQQFQLARTELPHASEREQLFITASDDFSQEKVDEAAAEYQHLLDLYPDDLDALRGFSESSYWAGRIDDAVAAERRALSISPNSVGDYAKLMTLLIRVGQFDESLKVLSQARAHGFDTQETQFVGAIAAWGKGDIQTARTTFSKLIASNDEYWRLVGYLYLGKLLAFQGRVAEANQAFNSGLLLVQDSERNDWVPVYQYMLACTALMTGDKQKVRSRTAELLAVSQTSPAPENLQRAGRLALETGSPPLSAEALRTRLKRQVADHGNLFAKMQLFTLQADLDLAYRRYDMAVQDARRALAFRPSFEPYLVLGQACEQMRNWQCAIDSYKSFLSFKGSIFRDDCAADWVLANYSLAKAYADAGRRSEAISQYDAFLQLFASADSNVPILRRAKEEAASLKEIAHG